MAHTPMAGECSRCRTAVRFIGECVGAVAGVPGMVLTNVCRTKVLTSLAENNQAGTSVFVGP